MLQDNEFLAEFSGIDKFQLFICWPKSEIPYFLVWLIFMRI